MVACISAGTTAAAACNCGQYPDPAAIWPLPHISTRAQIWKAEACHSREGLHCCSLLLTQSHVKPVPPTDACTLGFDAHCWPKMAAMHPFCPSGALHRLHTRCPCQAMLSLLTQGPLQLWCTPPAHPGSQHGANAVPPAQPGSDVQCLCSQCPQRLLRTSGAHLGPRMALIWSLTDSPGAGSQASRLIDALKPAVANLPSRFLLAAGNPCSSPSALHDAAQSCRRCCAR